MKASHPRIGSVLRRARPVALAALMAVVAGCPSPELGPPPDTQFSRIEIQRQDNARVWRGREKDILAQKGRWCVIDGGRFLGAADDLDSALSLRVEHAHPLYHRYVFRSGTDGDEVRWLGATDAPNIVGTGFLEDMGLEIAWDTKELTLSAGNRSVSFRAVEGQPVVDIEVSAPDGEGPTLQLTCVLATGFQGDLTLTDAQSRALGLTRFEIPGTVRLATVGRQEICRKCIVRVRLPKLRIARTLTACVPAS
jgi:hypothetical protein